jgi:hypothetical protein
MGWTFYNSSGEQLIYDAGSAIEQATQAEAEAESNVDKYIPPDLIKNSPGVAKAWCVIADGGGLNSGSYNVSSVTDTGTGTRDIVWDTDFADTLYSAVGSLASSDTGNLFLTYANFATGSIRHNIYNNATSLVDDPTSTAAYGDQ